MNTSPPQAVGRRTGRPTNAESVDARRLILDAARATFGTRGYEAATNRAIAADAGVTTGTLYHHFASKAVLFAAVYETAVATITGRLVDAIDEHTGINETLEAILEAAHRLAVEETSLTRFIGMSYVDLQRTPEILELCRPSTDAVGDAVRGVADRAVNAGEIETSDKPEVLALFAVFTVGLTVAASGSPARNRLAVDALKRLVRGETFGTPASD